MLYYDFKNYEGFKERFGVKGSKENPRKNKIILSYIKQLPLLERARLTNDYREINMTSMSALWETVRRKFVRRSNDYYYESNDHYACIEMLGLRLYSKKFKFDALNGICDDGTVNFVRYVNMENGRVWKMRVGKFIQKIAEENGFYLPEPVMLWMCEEITRQWEAHVASLSVNDYIKPMHLVVDDDFDSIYDGDCCDGRFGSCMTDEGQYTFYNDAVNAKAASLRRDSDDIIEARCVVYMEATDEDGCVYRLAERQYAPVEKFGDDSAKSNLFNSVMKRMLVDALIKGGHIDGYKQVGAGCGDDRDFVAVDGSSLSHKRFSIGCNLEDGDTLSYQDSFGYYDAEEHIAYNYEYEDGKKPILKTTSERFSRGNWDSWREVWTYNDVVTVYSEGTRYTIDEESWDFRDNFVEVHGEYHHVDDCFRCYRCDEWELQEDGVYSELTDEYYCCDECKDEAENEYKERYWYYCEYDEEYVENSEDCAEIHSWSSMGYYYTQTINASTLQKLIDNGDVIECDGEWYELPYVEEIAPVVKYCRCWKHGLYVRESYIRMDYVKVYEN